MIIKPTVTDLLEIFNNRFELVIVTSKRARQISGLSEGPDPDRTDPGKHRSGMGPEHGGQGSPAGSRRDHDCINCGGTAEGGRIDPDACADRGTNARAGNAGTGRDA